MATRANVFVVDWDAIGADLQNYIAIDPEGRVAEGLVFDPQEALVDWPTIRHNIRHGDIVQVGEDDSYYLFYDQTNDQLVPGVEAQRLEDRVAVPAIFMVPDQFPPRYWYNAVNNIEHVQIVPLERKLGQLGPNSIYLSAPYEQATGQQGQAMILPFVTADGKVYFAIDDVDLEVAVAGDDPQRFLNNVLTGNAIRIVRENLFGLEADSVLAVLRL